MNSKEHKHKWRAYGQPDGFVVCDDCNVGTDVNDLIKEAYTKGREEGYKKGYIDGLEQINKGVDNG